MIRPRSFTQGSTPFLRVETSPHRMPPPVRLPQKRFLQLAALPHFQSRRHLLRDEMTSCRPTVPSSRSWGRWQQAYPFLHRSVIEFATCRAARVRPRAATLSGGNSLAVYRGSDRPLDKTDFAPASAHRPLVQTEHFDSRYS